MDKYAWQKRDRERKEKIVADKALAKRQLKVKPIKKNSTKRARQEREYLNKLRPQFLQDNPVCQCCSAAIATEVHHRKGRIGILLVTFKWFFAVCSACHRQITDNSEWAIEMEYSISRLNK